jgi:hypothetical protein
VFLKHADEQTVASLTAVHQAIADHGLTGPFQDWGVIAAPRFLGRAAMAATLQRFAREGAWGISPHLIPHRSLHSIAGAISLALQVHGPNFGVGGGPDSAAQALIVAGTLLAKDNLPGLWVVLTAYHPEHVAEDPDRSSPDLAGPPVCYTVALALRRLETFCDGHVTSESVRRPRYLLHVSPASEPDEGQDPSTAAEEGRPFTLKDFLTFLSLERPGRCRWRLPNNGWVGLESFEGRTENSL